MVLPVKCFLSNATEALLKFRNPQGGEENWFGKEERINNIFTHIGKVAIAEIGTGILLTASYVQNFALFIFLIISCPFHSEQFATRIADLRSSVAFTARWNFSNLIMNPFCTNLATDESVARFTLDNWTRGKIFSIAEAVTFIAAAAFSLLTFWNGDSIAMILAALQSIGLNMHEEINASVPRAFCFSAAAIFCGVIPGFAKGENIRISDVIYLHNLIYTKRIILPRFMQGLPLYLRPLVNDLTRVNYLTSGSQQIEQKGIDIFNTYIFNNAQIDIETKNNIAEADADALVFALSRMIFVYAFVEQNEPLNLFKPAVRRMIEALRETNPSDGEALDHYMSNMNGFNDAPNNEAIRYLFNKIKEAAYTEYQGASIFIQKCSQRACEAYLAHRQM